MPELNVRRNTILLSAAVAVNSCLFQLAAAVNSLTFVLITGVRGLLGLGPAIFLASSGLAALPAGSAMDRFGRRPVIVCGFLVAALGCSLVAVATRTDSTIAVISGMALTGAAGGVALLIRTAAGDMYPPERALGESRTSSSARSSAGSSARRSSARSSRASTCTCTR